MLCPSLNYISPRLASVDPSSVSMSKSLRIGFISAHFYDHSIGRMLAEMFLLMNDISSLFEPVNGGVLSFDYKVFFIDQTLTYDGHWREPTSKRIDSISGQLLDKLGSDRFIFLPDNLSLIREIVGTQHELDVLILADIGMDLTSYLLSHARLAPYQVIIICSVNYFRVRLRGGVTQ